MNDIVIETLDETAPVIAVEPTEAPGIVPDFKTSQIGDVVGYIQEAPEGEAVA